MIVIIVRKTSINIIKKEWRETSFGYDDSIVWAESAPDVQNIINGGISGVLDSLAELNKPFNDILMLKYVYGYQNIEIAELLGITPQNVAVGSHCAKKILKIKLEEKEYEFE